MNSLNHRKQTSRQLFTRNGQKLPKQETTFRFFRDWGCQNFKMAEHFMESDIEEFSDAFGLFVTDKRRRISNKEEMKHIMRSLGYSPTIREIDYYYGKYSKDGIIDFATFLQAMYEHSQKEKCEQEIRAGFMSQDRGGNGQISSTELWHMLTNFGEKLSQQEAESLFKEVGIQQGGSVDYNKIIYKLLPRVGES